MQLKAWERYDVIVRNLGAENDYYWTAEIPQLDGCKAYGQTREAAMEALQGVAEAYVEIAEEDGEPLPLPLAEVPQRYSGRFVVRVTASLHRSLAERAKAEGVSLNHLCYELLAMGIGERRAVRPINHYHFSLPPEIHRVGALQSFNASQDYGREYNWQRVVERRSASTLYSESLASAIPQVLEERR
jgi:antitoxin HicB